MQWVEEKGVSKWGWGGCREVTAKSVQGIIGEQIGFDKFVEVEVMQSFKEKRANTGIP